MAHKNKPPAFQFYVNDWASSLQVRAMTPAQRGCYIDLLAASWPDGIPACIPLWTLTACRTQEEFESVKDLVLAQFKVQDGVWVHPKLAEQWKQLKKYHKTQQDKAKKGANARWHGSGKDRAVPEGASSSSSSTASSSAPSDPVLSSVAGQNAAATGSRTDRENSSAQFTIPQEVQDELDRGQYSIADRLHVYEALRWTQHKSDWWSKRPEAINLRNMRKWMGQYDSYYAKASVKPHQLALQRIEQGTYGGPTAEQLDESVLDETQGASGEEEEVAASKAFEIVED